MKQATSVRHSSKHGRHGLPDLVLLLLPLAAMLPWLLIPKGDQLIWLRWLGGMLLPTLAIWPLGHRLFRRNAALSFTFSLALGPLLLSFISWTGAYLHFLPFTTPILWLILLALAGLFWSRKAWRRQLREDLLRADGYRPLLFFLCIFILAYGAWSFVRGQIPNADGLEKFMDYGYMMSLWRSRYLPAADMWMAGKSINYYYYGQFFYTLLGKLVGLAPRKTYNLAVASSFAYFLTLSAALGYQLAGLSGLSGLRLKLRQYSQAILTAFFAGIAGNSQAFFYADNAPGRVLIDFLNAHGFNLGTTGSWYFSNATRFIGYNPATNDKTIHEFPYYSFLVADLHAHVINTLFVLLFLGLLISYFSLRDDQATAAKPAAGAGRRRPSLPRRPARSLLLNWIRRHIKDTDFIYSFFFALLLSVFMMGNFWDFAIYFVVLIFVRLAMSPSRPFKELRFQSVLLLIVQFVLVFIPFLTVSQPLLALLLMFAAYLFSYFLAFLLRDPLLDKGRQLVGIFTAAHLFSLPFNWNFEPIAKTLALAEDHTPLWQLLVLWGPQLLLGFILLISCLRQLSRGQGRLPASDRLSLWFLLCAVGLILAPEVIYVVDIYENSYARANTMFKFTYQAFILLALVMADTLPRLFDRALSRYQQLAPDAVRTEAGTSHRQAIKASAARSKRPWHKVITAFVPLLLAVLLLLPPAWYPFEASGQWIPGWSESDYRGLDAAIWMETATDTSATIQDTQYEYDLSGDYAAIEWFNQNVSGQPVIVEAAGWSYTHFNRISAYTGLPAVLGWETHEWLWRTSKETPNAYQQVIYPLQQAIQAFYENTADQAAFIQEHQIAYIVVGELETIRYPNLDRSELESLGTVVFRQGVTEIIAVNSSGT
ncbi:hypothetical protein HCH52_10300 [Oscillospiraceae bacterium HV4-5-C5C]|nr:hypothetical protein [Oscillospiraceae bacterium HV4-5-C5C]